MFLPTELIKPRLTIGFLHLSITCHEHRNHLLHFGKKTNTQP